LAADLEQQALRDGASQGQGQLEAREGAGLRLDFDLAAHACDRALDDVHAHPASGPGIGLGARRETGLEDGADQILVAGVAHVGQLPRGLQGAADGRYAITFGCG
jgi:hypothetical protein